MVVGEILGSHPRTAAMTSCSVGWLGTCEPDECEMPLMEVHVPQLTHTS